MLKSLMELIRRDSKGNTTLIVCFSMVVLLGAGAFIIDIGYTYAQRVHLSNAIDAAALAGAMELPDKPTQAYNVAVDYLVKNDIDPALTQITIGADNRSIAIDAHENVQHFLAPVIGIDFSRIQVSNKVGVGPLKMVNSGIRPIAVEVFPYNYGDQIVLKEDAGDGYHGNYGAVQLGGTGTNVLRDNIMYGYNGSLTIGDAILTKPGVLSAVNNTIKTVISSDSSDFQNIQRGSERLWTLPIVDTLIVDGSKPVTILGFAQFYIEDVKNAAGGKTEITGRFVRYVGSGEIDFDEVEMGAVGVKLTE